MTAAVLERPPAVLADFEIHRPALTGYCSRVLGSPTDAEDAVQETMVRAWRGASRFEGRASVRSWLYRIATNVCTDALAARQRRPLPIDLGPYDHDAPIPAEHVDPTHDPSAVAVQHDEVRRAFASVLRLPPRQTAVVILREVLRWRAAEVADLLGATPAAVNGALQRARAAMAADVPGERLATDPVERQRLDRYVAAFLAYDHAALVAMLRDDALTPGRT